MPSGISPGGRPIDESTLNKSPKKNWVEKAGGLPPYVRGIARGVAKKHGGKVTSTDIAIAISQIKKLAATSKNPAVKAAAAAAVVRWEASKSKNLSATDINRTDIEMAGLSNFGGKRHIFKKGGGHTTVAPGAKGGPKPDTSAAGKSNVDFAKRMKAQRMAAASNHPSAKK